MPVPTIQRLSNEGAEIYCERWGNGPILLLIHGAMEDAGFYSAAASIVADGFTVVTDAATPAALAIEALK